ncbi:glycosyltransferase WbuB [Synechococcus sp. CS-205]|uniref:glycosyltransferase WbuB n=1 Tax=Synechococcus sp. CS-205 TaxID=2847984 RepID=UPI00223AA3FD|nr:glycosyltransferase WbuB [Synechococcus sp. CS-205]MCT0249265.1 glycosyltransferase WbuB [Synechococcus sp. CS-205]
MRILIYGINYSPEPVGIGKYNGEISTWLASRHHDVRVICAPPYFPHWQVGLRGVVHTGFYRNAYRKESVDGIRVQRCPLWVPSRPTGLTRLLHLASFALSSLVPLLAQARWKPDVVFTVAPAFFCAPGALLLVRLCGRRSRSWLHIQDFELDAAFELGMLRGRLVRRLAERWERSVLRGFKRVSSISEAMVRRLEEKGVDQQRTALLPNWVDLEAIRPQGAAERATNPYRQELAIGPEQIVLLYSGSMNKKQGLDLLAQVIQRLTDRRDLVWLLAGEGPTKAELARACEGLPQVRLLPLQPVERLNDWLNAADIHLLPQKTVAADLVLPSKLLGMLASGRPVIATTPEGSELAELAAEAGLCVPPEDVEAFTAAARRLVDDPALRAAQGVRARQLAEQRFGREAVLQRLEHQWLQELELQ